jgi:hypothetical protein
MNSIIGYWKEVFGDNFYSIRQFENPNLSQNEIKSMLEYLNNGYIPMSSNVVSPCCLYGGLICNYYNHDLHSASIISNGIVSWRSDIIHYIKYHNCDIGSLLYEGGNPATNIEHFIKTCIEETNSKIDYSFSNVSGLLDVDLYSNIVKKIEFRIIESKISGDMDQIAKDKAALENYTIQVS